MKQIPKDFAGKIRALLEKCKGNQSEAARMIDCSPSYISRIIAGETPRDPKRKTLAALHRALGLPVSNTTQIDAGVKMIKIYGMAQALGCRVHHGDIIPENEYILDEIPVLDTGKREAGFKVEGDSMLPTLRDGWVVVCDVDAEPANGNIVVAKWDDTAVIKRFRRVGDICLFTSENPSVGKDYEVHLKDIDWMLKVVKFVGEL